MSGLNNSKTPLILQSISLFSLTWFIIVIAELLILQSGSSAQEAATKSTWLSHTSLATTPVEKKSQVVSTTGSYPAAGPLVLNTAKRIDSASTISTRSNQVINTALIGILVALLVGLVQSIIAFFTVKEMRISRRQSVQPFVTVQAIGDNIRSFAFKLSNEGVGLALTVCCYLNSVDYTLGNVDLIQPQKPREIRVDFTKIKEWTEKPDHRLLIYYHDVYSNTFEAEFLIKNEGVSTHFPIRDSIVFQKVRERREIRFLKRHKIF